MGFLKIGRGIAKMVKGAIEGDIAEVGKGALKTGVGIITTLMGVDNDDSEDSD